MMLLFDKRQASLQLDYFIHFLLSFYRVGIIIVYSISIGMRKKRKKKKTLGLVKEKTKRGPVVFYIIRVNLQ
jgi:hypothetical protein